jgi:copper chaperone CopZ
MERIEIQNLKCEGCGKTITNGLSKIRGIQNVQVHVSESVLSFESSSFESLTTAKKQLIKLGYPPVGEKNSLGTKAKSYVSCAIGKIA